MKTRPRKPKNKKTGKGGQVHVKSHTRSPRGPNAGKRIVRVPAYQRRKARHH